MATYKSNYTGAQIDEAVGQGLEYGVTRETIVLDRAFIENLSYYEDYVYENPNYVLSEGVNLPFKIKISPSKKVNPFGFIEIYNKRNKNILIAKWTCRVYSNGNTAYAMIFHNPYISSDSLDSEGYGFGRGSSNYVSFKNNLPCQLNDELEIIYTYGYVNNIFEE